MGVLVMTLAPCGCGGEPAADAPRPGERADASAARPGIIPEYADVVVLVSLDESASGTGWGAARATLARIPGWARVEEADVLPAPLELLDIAARELGDPATSIDLVDWAGTPHPSWMGDEGGVASWTVTGEEANGHDPAVVAWVDVTDADDAAAHMVAAGGDHARVQRHGGVDISCPRADDAPARGLGGGCWSIIADRLVVARAQGSIEAVIDAAAGTAFEETGDWEVLTSARDADHRRSQLLAVLLTRTMVDRMRQARASHDDGDEGGAGEREEDEGVAAVALQAGVTDRGPWIDSVLLGDLPATPRLTGAAAVLGRLPIGSVAGVGWVAPVPVRRELAELVGREDLSRAAVGVEAWSPVAANVLEDALHLVETVDVLTGSERGEPGPSFGARSSAIGIGQWDGELALVGGADAGSGSDQRRSAGRVTTWGGEVPWLGPRGRRLQAGWSTSSDVTTFASPPGAMHRITSSWAAGSDVLAADPAFAEALERADVPDAALVCGWLDATRIARHAADRIGGRTAQVMAAQLVNVDGPVGWLEVEPGDEDRAVWRIAVELPIRDA